MEGLWYPDNCHVCQQGNTSRGRKRSAFLSQRRAPPTAPSRSSSSAEPEYGSDAPPVKRDGTPTRRGTFPSKTSEITGQEDELDQQQQYSQQEQQERDANQESSEFYDEEGYWEKQEPPDVIELGQAGWTLLHSMAASYPRQPSADHRARMRTFLSLFPHLYPCQFCAKDFEGILSDMPPDVESRESLSQWMCRAHNRVNQKLDKPLFPCDRVLERWLHTPVNNNRKKEEEDVS